MSVQKWWPGSIAVALGLIALLAFLGGVARQSVQAMSSEASSRSVVNVSPDQDWLRPELSPSLLVATITLEPSEDTTVSEHCAFDGFVPYIRVGKDAVCGIQRGLMAFDVSSIPPGSTVHAATLNMVWRSGLGATDPMTMTTYRVTSPWSEELADYSVSFEETYGSVSIPVTFTVPSTFALDVTGLVGGWVLDAFPNYGVMLRSDDEAAENWREFGSREAAAGLEPTLVIVYTPPTPVPGSDAYEPDDVIPAPIALGSVQNRNFYPTGDIDNVTFDVLPGRQYRVNTFNLAPGVDTVITATLTTTVGLTQTFFSDDVFPGVRDSKVSFDVPFTGTVTVAIVNRQGQYGTDRTYDLTAVEITPPEGDPYEPDDFLPKPITIGVPQTHSFHPQGDVDKVSFSAKAGLLYILTTSNLAVGVDTVITATLGVTQVVTNDDVGPGIFDSEVSFIAQEDGTAEVTITNKGDYGLDKTYDLLLSLGAVDEFEPDDDTPRSVQMGRSEAHNFYPEGDVDMVGFAVKPDTDYVVSTANLAPGVDTILTVDGIGFTCEPFRDLPPCINDDVTIGVNLASEVRLRGDTDGGPARVRVENKGQYGPDKTYQLAVVELTTPPGDSFEPDDITPKPISIGETQPRAFDTADDIDQVEFLAKAGRWYVVTTADLVIGVDTVITVTQGAQVLVNDDIQPGNLASQIRFQAATDGTALVTIANLGQAGSDMTYNITVDEFVPDVYEPDDVVPSPIAIGETQTHTFYPEGDIDKVQFLAKQDRWYRVFTTIPDAPPYFIDTVITVTLGAQTVSNDDVEPTDLSSYVELHAGSTGTAVVTIANLGEYDPDREYMITVEEFVPTPTPTRTPTPTWTLTPIPTNTPTPTVTPTPTDTPTITPTPTNTPVPTPTTIPSPTTVVWVKPPDQTVLLPTSPFFVVSVAITDVVDLGGFQFDLLYDPSVVHVNSVNLSSFLGSTGRAVEPFDPVIDNGAGIVSFGAVSYGTQAGRSGSGDLATLMLQPQAEGRTNLLLQGVGLSDTGNVPLAHSVRDGRVVVRRCIQGDFDCDCDVDIFDLVGLAAHYGTQSGDPLYDPLYDVDGDGDIDLFDLVAVAAQWGDRCPARPIAFVSSREDLRELNVYTMQADGSSVVNLDRKPAAELAWSPDHTRIAFARHVGGFFGNKDLYVMDANGANLRRLTTHTANDTHPTWSPDGTKIAFQSHREGDWEIYILDLDTGGLVNVTNDPASDVEPDWSPDGQWIAFSSKRDGNWEIYRARVDGTSVMNLTVSASNDSEPAWSPDGQRIAFTTDRDGNKEIYEMEPDGRNPRNLTNHWSNDSYPAWSSDGRQIVFTTERDGNPEIYVMQSDGRSQVNLTRNPAIDRYPDW